MTNSFRALALVTSLIVCSLALAFGTLNLVTHSAEAIGEITGSYSMDYSECWDEPGRRAVCGDYRTASDQAGNFRDAQEVQVIEGTVSASAWDCLRGYGLTGRPGDGVEALYPMGAQLDVCAATDVI